MQKARLSNSTNSWFVQFLPLIAAVGQYSSTIFVWMAREDIGEYQPRGVTYDMQSRSSLHTLGLSHVHDREEQILVLQRYMYWQRS
jgi:hypothetical protein